MLTIIQFTIHAQTTSQPVTLFRGLPRNVRIIHPLFTFNKNGTQRNFDDAYVGGLTTEINKYICMQGIERESIIKWNK